MAVRTAKHVKDIDVLLIEDEANHSQLGRVLNQGGYRVQAATDGIKGLLHTRTALPRLIVVDVPLPGLNGFHVISMIRQTPHLSKVPVVMLTRAGHDDDRQRALELGATSTLPRPEADRQLCPTVQRLFDAQSA